MIAISEKALEEARKKCVALGVFKPQSLQTYAEYERNKEILREVLTAALEAQGEDHA